MYADWNGSSGCRVQLQQQAMTCDTSHSRTLDGSVFLWMCSAAQWVCVADGGTFAIVDKSLAVILLLSTTSKGSRGHPKTDLAFVISLSSLFLSAAMMLLPQQTTEWKMADAPTVSKKVLYDLSPPSVMTPTMVDLSENFCRWQIVELN